MGRRGQPRKCDTLKLQTSPLWLRAEHRGRETFCHPADLLKMCWHSGAHPDPQPPLPSKLFCWKHRVTSLLPSLVTSQSYLCALLGCTLGRVQGTLADWLQQGHLAGDHRDSQHRKLLLCGIFPGFRLGQHGEDGF